MESTQTYEFTNVNSDLGFSQDVKLPASSKELTGILIEPVAVGANVFVKKLIGEVSVLIGNANDMLIDCVGITAINKAAKVSFKQATKSDLFDFSEPIAKNSFLRVVYKNLEGVFTTNYNLKIHITYK